jgi:acyl-coenzyme A thioesterase PaaI-like protein
MRDLGHALVGHHASAALLEEIAGTLEDLAGRLRAGGDRSRPPTSFYAWQAEPRDGEPMTSFGDRPISGACSPWGVDLDIRRDGNRAVGEVTLRSAHEGAPGRSHGGVVAAIFDDLMGFVLQIEQVAAFTGELTVRYLHPAPLHVPLRFQAWLEERVGRKLFVHAEAWHDDQCLARAGATFIAAQVPSTLFAP